MKLAVVAGAVLLAAATPLGLLHVTPSFGVEDLVKGCGVICLPSYLLDYDRIFAESYVTPDRRPPVVVRLLLEDFDLNRDRFDYEALLDVI